MFHPNKIRAVCLPLIFMFVFCGCMEAITVEIDPAGRNVIDFEDMNPGEYKELPSSGYWHALVVKNSVSSAWQVSVSCDGVLRNGSSTIPSSVFGWMATYAGAKDAPYDSYSDGLLPLAYRPFYESGQAFFLSANSSKLVDAGHLTTPSGAEIQLKYFLSIPDSQLAGDYTSKITYTVTQ
ncbi:MAG: hypothetical protein WC527_00085 [Candidatus Margulisiibacteriota bacterium]